MPPVPKGTAVFNRTSETHDHFIHSQASTYKRHGSIAVMPAAACGQTARFLEALEVNIL